MANKSNAIKKALILVRTKDGKWVSGIFTSWVYDSKGVLTLHLKGKDDEVIKVDNENIDGAYLGIPNFIDKGVDA